MNKMNQTIIVQNSNLLDLYSQCMGMLLLDLYSQCMGMLEVVEAATGGVL